MLARLFVVFAVFTGIMTASAARADSWYHSAEVVCADAGDVALVRFTMSIDDEPVRYTQLPPELDDGLSVHPNTSSTDCTMSNGWSLRVRIGSEQGFAYGAGGADPPAFFSLWIDERKVYSRRQWKSGYHDRSETLTVAAVVRPDRIVFCRTVGVIPPDSSGLDCQDESLAIESFERDAVEYAPPGTQPAVGETIVLPGAPNPEFCHTYLREEQYKEGAPAWSQIMRGERKSFSRYESISLNGWLYEFDAGSIKQVIHWGDTTHYYDGDMFFLAPAGMNPWEVLRPQVLDNGPDGEVPDDWVVIEGGQFYPQAGHHYVHLSPIGIDGELYLIATPTNVELKPSWMLVRVLANGAEIMCQFQVVEPNY